MDDFERFLREQGQIYQKFKRLSDEAKEKGTKRDPFMAPKPKIKSGYLIGLVHPPEITDVVGQFSERIKAEAPVIIYPKDVLHTTFSNYDVKVIMPDGQTALDKDISDKLCQAAYSCRRNWGIEIGFSSWLYNLTTIIVEGHPNPAFLECAKEIKKAAAALDIELGLPWGAHMTADRFLKEAGPENLKGFFKLMEEAPAIGVSRPTHLRVGYFILSDGINSYKPIELFPLQGNAR